MTVTNPETFITAERARDINLEHYIDQRGSLELDGLTVGITVKEARVRFGHLDLLVSPIAGQGERWVEARRISLQG